MVVFIHSVFDQNTCAQCGDVICVVMVVLGCYIVMILRCDFALCKISCCVVDAYRVVLLLVC